MRSREARSLNLLSPTELKPGLIFSCVILFLSGCATIQGVQGARFEFALLGDVPYDARQEKEFVNVMRNRPADLAFVVHNGLIWWDGAAGRKRRRAPTQ